MDSFIVEMQKPVRKLLPWQEDFSRKVVVSHSYANKTEDFHVKFLLRYDNLAVEVAHLTNASCILY